MRRNVDLAQITALADEAAAGSRRATGRLLSLVERGGPAADQLADVLWDRSRQSHIVGITGAPGSGKSTLVGRLVAALAHAGARPAVLAVDPSSPLTGGAILGDRVRMDDVVESQDVFIRSMATRGHQGGLALAVPGAIRVLDAAGYDPIIVETVGVGQVEVDVVATADTAVMVVAPGYGDAVQANKAGLLEVADIFVVNKADRHGANDARRDLELMLDLGHVSGVEDPTGWRPPIAMTTATTGDGIDALPELLERHSDHLQSTGQAVLRQANRWRAEVQSRLEQQANLRIAELVGSALSDAKPEVSAASLANQLVAELFAPRPD